MDVNGFDLSCDSMGKGDVSKQGHLHVYLDDVLVNYYCTPDIRTLSIGQLVSCSGHYPPCTNLLASARIALDR